MKRNLRNERIKIIAYNKNKKKLKKVLLLIIFYTGVIIIFLSLLVPYLWMVSGSFKSSNELVTSDSTISGQEPTWIPRKITLENYLNVNETIPMFKYLKNSFYISCGTMVFTILISMFAAYGMSRIRFEYKKCYEILLFSTQLAPGVIYLIPFYLMFLYIQKIFNISLMDTFTGIIFAYTSFALPFAILMLKNYMNSIPIEIDEQARIDGCTRSQVIFKIIFPLARPGIVSISLFAFILSWGEIMMASVLTKNNTKPVSVGLMDFVSRITINWGGMMAACVIVSIPVLIFFTFLQRYIVSGMVQGATKG